MSIVTNPYNGVKWQKRQAFDSEKRHKSLNRLIIRGSVKNSMEQSFDSDYTPQKTMVQENSRYSNDKQSYLNQSSIMSDRQSRYISQERKGGPIFDLNDTGKVSSIITKRIGSYNEKVNAQRIAANKLNKTRISMREKRGKLQDEMSINVPLIEQSKAAGVVKEPQKHLEEMIKAGFTGDAWEFKEPKVTDKSITINNLLQSYSQQLDTRAFHSNGSDTISKGGSLRMPKIDSQKRFNTEVKHTRFTSQESQITMSRASAVTIEDQISIPDINHLKQLHKHIKTKQGARIKTQGMTIIESSEETANPLTSVKSRAKVKLQERIVQENGLCFDQNDEGGHQKQSSDRTQSQVWRVGGAQAPISERDQDEENVRLGRSVSIKKSSTKIQSTKELMKELKAQHKKVTDRKKLNDLRMMKGRTLYKLPETQDVRNNFKQSMRFEQNIFLKTLAKDADQTEGWISLNNKYSKSKERATQNHNADPTQKYVNHFSQFAEIIEGQEDSSRAQNISSFAKSLQAQLKTNEVKVNIKHALFKNMSKARESREESSPEIKKTKNFTHLSDTKTLEQKQNAFSKSLEEETKQMGHIAQTILRKGEYQKKFSQIQKYNDQVEDPRIQFFNKCSKDGDLVLPILDKIWKKTLCLNNYFLSEGNIKGLASACEVLDFRLVNRLLLNNCGITGDQFAEIIDGMAKLRDFKSLVYKQNAINEKSIQSLKPILEKRIPHHLEELKIIDCKVAVKDIVFLMESLLQVSQLKKLALINVHHTVGSFEKVIQFIEESEFLEEIDLSWSIVPKGCWLKLTNVLKENKTLRNLQIGYNRLLDDQSWKLTSAQISAGMTDVPLSPKNEELLEGLKMFMKYNPMLVHLDLQMTGLPAQVIRMIGDFMTRATGLQSIHLCGNEGISEEMIQWLRRRIRAKDSFTAPTIVPLDKKQIRQQEAPKPVVSNALNLFGIGKKTSSPQEPIDPQKEWKELRAGLKLQSIVNSKRMTEVIQPTLLDKRTCIIYRHLGYTNMIPGAAQWKILTEAKDECWFCGQHILSLFVWSPRIGQLSQMKGIKARKHFKDQFDALKADEDFLPQFFETPHIKSAFTDWQPKAMREIISFCSENDQNPPNFVPQLILDNLIRAACGEPTNEKLNAHEQSLVNTKLEIFYEEQWASVIMDIVQFRNPLVANAHAMTSMTTKTDPGNPIFFHIDWVKPGRHNFFVEHDQDGGIIDEKDESDVYNRRLHNFMQDKMRQGKKSTQNFYAHEMLATLRSDALPVAYKERHTTTVHRKMFKPKPVFSSWIQDTHDTYRRAIEYDTRFIPVLEIVNQNQIEAKSLITALTLEYASVKDLFHFLQAQSRSYPTIDTGTMHTKFIRLLELSGAGTSMQNRTVFDIVLSEVYSNNVKNLVKGGVIPGFTRAMFTEVILRASKLLYTDSSVNDYDQIKISQAFKLFFSNQLKPFIDKQDVNWQAFRDQNLSNPEVELVFTMNMNTIDLIYRKYSKLHQDTEHKKHNEEFLVMIDVIQLFHKDSLLKVPTRLVKSAFSMSKMTVIQEMEQDGQQQYKKMTKVEFLEFISRIAELSFHESELEELHLYEKIEYILDDIFPLVGAKRVKQQIAVEEFSESDEDY